MLCLVAGKKCGYRNKQIKEKKENFKFKTWCSQLQRFQIFLSIIFIIFSHIFLAKKKSEKTQKLRKGTHLVIGLKHFVAEVDSFSLSVSVSQFSLALSLSLSLNFGFFIHTRTHTHIYIYIYRHMVYISPSPEPHVFISFPC